MTSILAGRVGIRGRLCPHAPEFCLRQCSSPTFRRWQSSLLSRAAPHLPRIFQPATWESVIPPTIRAKTKALFSERRRRPTNPATYFIWIYILIGSQAIRILQVKNDHATYSRKAELQLEKLREVVQKLQAGEEVNVEKVLGTNDPNEEDAWEEALREIEKEERIWAESKRQKRERKRREREEREQGEKEREDASPINAAEESQPKMMDAQPGQASKPPFAAPGFY